MDELEEDVCDIYGDLPQFEFGQECEKLQKELKVFQERTDDFLAKINELTAEKEKLLKQNRILQKNISILLKTAKGELARKDKQISELRNELSLLQARPFGFSKRNNPSVSPAVPTLVKEETNKIQKVSTGTQTELSEEARKMNPSTSFQSLEHFPDLAELICEGKESSSGESKNKMSIGSKMSSKGDNRSGARHVRARLGPIVDRGGRGSGKEESEARHESQRERSRRWGDREQERSWNSKKKCFDEPLGSRRDKDRVRGERYRGRRSRSPHLGRNRSKSRSPYFSGSRHRSRSRSPIKLAHKETSSRTSSSHLSGKSSRSKSPQKSSIRCHSPRVHSRSNSPLVLSKSPPHTDSGNYSASGQVLGNVIEENSQSGEAKTVEIEVSPVKQETLEEPLRHQIKSMPVAEISDQCQTSQVRVEDREEGEMSDSDYFEDALENPTPTDDNTDWRLSFRNCRPLQHQQPSVKTLFSRRMEEKLKREDEEAKKAEKNLQNAVDLSETLRSEQNSLAKIGGKNSTNAESIQLELGSSKQNKSQTEQEVPKPSNVKICQRSVSNVTELEPFPVKQDTIVESIENEKNVVVVEASSTLRHGVNKGVLEDSNNQAEETASNVLLSDRAEIKKSVTLVEAPATFRSRVSEADVQERNDQAGKTTLNVAQEHVAAVESPDTSRYQVSDDVQERNSEAGKITLNVADESVASEKSPATSRHQLSGDVVDERCNEASEVQLNVSEFNGSGIKEEVAVVEAPGTLVHRLNSQLEGNVITLTPFKQQGYKLEPISPKPPPPKVSLLEYHYSLKRDAPSEESLSPGEIVSLAVEKCGTDIPAEVFSKEVSASSSHSEQGLNSTEENDNTKSFAGEAVSLFTVQKPLKPLTPTDILGSLGPHQTDKSSKVDATGINSDEANKDMTVETTIVPTEPTFNLSTYRIPKKKTGDLKLAPDMFGKDIGGKKEVNKKSPPAVGKRKAVPGSPVKRKKTSVDNSRSEKKLAKAEKMAQNSETTKHRSTEKIRETREQTVQKKVENPVVENSQKLNLKSEKKNCDKVDPSRSPIQWKQSRHKKTSPGSTSPRRKHRQLSPNVESKTSEGKISCEQMVKSNVVDTESRESRRKDEYSKQSENISSTCLDMEIEESELRTDDQSFNEGRLVGELHPSSLIARDFACKEICSTESQKAEDKSSDIAKFEMFKSVSLSTSSSSGDRSHSERLQSDFLLSDSRSERLQSDLHLSDSEADATKGRGDEEDSELDQTTEESSNSDSDSAASDIMSLF